MDKEFNYNDRLIYLRKDKDKTINDMAYEVEISASTISNYEKGVRIPDGKALIKLAKYFNCTTDYLLGISDIKNIKEKELFDNLEENLISLIKTIYNSNDRFDIINALSGLVMSYAGLSSEKNRKQLQQSIKESIENTSHYLHGIYLFLSDTIGENFGEIESYWYVKDNKDDAKDIIDDVYRIFDIIIKEEYPQLIDARKKTKEKLQAIKYVSAEKFFKNIP